MEIKNLKVGENEPPFIIAELSANHGGSIERAKPQFSLQRILALAL